MLSEKENALSNRGHEKRANPELIEGKKNPNPKERLGSETLTYLVLIIGRARGEE